MKKWKSKKVNYCSPSNQINIMKDKNEKKRYICLYF